MCNKQCTLESVVSPNLIKFAEQIADANADMTMDDLVTSLANASWSLIANIDYGDSTAKIYRTFDLNSTVDCVDLEELDSFDKEDYVVFRNVYGELSLYLANSPVDKLTVSYCDMIIDSELGMVFSPMTVMQAINDEIKDDIDVDTIWSSELLDLFGIKIVALHPNVRV